MAKNTRKIKPETNFADEVLHSLTDFGEAIDRGETITVRTVKLDLLELDPGKYDAEDVRRTRMKLDVSQAIFARLLGVTVRAVQHWEQGRRPPTGSARQLMDDFNEQPQKWRKKVSRAADAASRKRECVA